MLTLAIISSLFTAGVNATAPILIKKTQLMAEDRFMFFLLSVIVASAIILPFAAAIFVLVYRESGRALRMTVGNWKYIGLLSGTITWVVVGSLVFTYGVANVSNSELFIPMAIVASAFVINFLIARLWLDVGDQGAWANLKAQPWLVWVAITLVIVGIVLIAKIGYTSAADKAKTT